MNASQPPAAAWWREYPLPASEPQCWQVGPLRLWCRTHQHDFWLAFEHEESQPESLTAADGEPPGMNEAPEEPPVGEPPEVADWLRWALKESYGRLRLSPAFPDLPIVVKPEAAFILAPHVEACVYVRCPLWVKIELVGREERTIKEIPTVVLSHTWFGDFLAGTLCYWISSGAQRELAPDPGRPFLAICPIRISNRSDEDLSVEKICLRVEQLSLFAAGDQLWTDELSVSYRGSNNVSQIKATGKAPANAANARRIAKPRDPVRQSFAAKTFLSLKALPGLGMLME